MAPGLLVHNDNQIGLHVSSFETVDDRYGSDYSRQEWQTKHLFFQEMHVVELLLFRTTEPDEKYLVYL